MNFNKSKNEFQLNGDLNIEETGTISITEANSNENLISNDDDDKSDNTTNDHNHLFKTSGRFARFLSVPSLRSIRTMRNKRVIATSPAKSEPLEHDAAHIAKLDVRRLSQDSGIVAGRITGVADLTFQQTNASPCNDAPQKVYNFLLEPTNLSPRAPSPLQHLREPNEVTPLSWHDKPYKSLSSSCYLGDVKARSNVNYLTRVKTLTINRPLPTHIEMDSTESNSEQLFGPKVSNVDAGDDNFMASTALSYRQLNLQLSIPSTPTNYRKECTMTTNEKLPDQFNYKRLESYEEKLTNTRNPSCDSNFNDKRNSKPTNDNNNANDNNDVINYNSKENKESLDPESLMFRDGKRCIDMIVAWEEENFGVMTEIESKRRDSRHTFMENLIKEGLEVELEDKSQAFDEKTFFLKIHLPTRLESRLAEVMNLKLPTKRFITISVKASWSEDNVMSHYIRQYKELWQRLTKQMQLDHEILEGEITYKAATAKGNPEEQFIVKDRATSYTSAQRSLMVMQVLLRTPFDGSDRCGIRRLLNDKTYLACFPLHEGRYDRCSLNGAVLTRRKLYLTWARPSQWFKRQPLCMVRKYFGDKIALYFCWLGFYTEMLVYPAVVGTICFLYGLASLDSEDNTPSKEICNEYGPGNITLCPLCDKACSYQRLHESCLFSRLTYLFDNPSTVFFAIFMSFWATTFLELWKRKQSVLIWEWDLRSVEGDEESRPEFETNATNFRINPVTREREPYMSMWNRTIRFAITSSAVIFMICVVLAAVLGTIIYRLSVVTIIYSGGGFFVKEHAKLFTTVTAALINLVVIMLLTRIYHRLAIALTNLENPRTQTEYEDSYTFKIFFFEFMNFYSSLIYIAFFKMRFFDYPGDDQARKSEFYRLKNDICDPAGCLSELCIQLAIIMIGKQCWNNFMEYLFPKVYNWWRHRKHQQATKNETHLHMAWEQDYHMQDPGRLALFDEYLEMILQYGFVTLFVAAFPLAPLFALLNNVAEIRLDAFKMVTQARRPLAERVQNIGAWYGILRIITYTAVVSNAFVIAYTSDFIPRMVYKYVYSETYTLSGYIEHSLSWFNTSDYKEEWGAKTEKDPDTCAYRGYRNGPEDTEPYGLSPQYWHVFAARLAFVVIFEHVVVVITGIMQFLIPDIPAEVKTQIQREKLLAKEAKYQHGIKRAQQGDTQDLISVFREVTQRNNSVSDSGMITSHRRWSRRLSRLSDTLDAHVEVAVNPQSTVWEIS